MKLRKLLCALLAALFALGLPLAALAEIEPPLTNTEYVARVQANETLLKALFPKLRSMESKETRFVFASAPVAVKTRAVFKGKGETLTFFRVGTHQALNACVAMMRGNSLVYGSKTVYVDTSFPATYYYNVSENIVALYCGAEEAVDKILTEHAFVAAGGIGGYFAPRYRFTAPDGTVILTPPKGDGEYPDTLKALWNAADSIYLVKVMGAPKWDGAVVTGRYDLLVAQNIKGIERTRFFFGDYPGVMLVNRSYVMFVRHVGTDSGSTRILFADEVHHPAFEVDDRGYVLPIRAYGMKAPVKLAAFLRNSGK